MLRNAQGDDHAITLPPDVAAQRGGLDLLLGREVTVRVAPSVHTADATAPFVTRAVSEIIAVQPALAPVESADATRDRWLLLLCRPPEYNNTLPNPQAHYGTLLSSAAPGMDHFWGELSYGRYGLENETVLGWYTLPKTWSAYIEPILGGYMIDRSALWPDCTGAADADVYYPDYEGIVFVIPVAPVGVSRGLRTWYAYGESPARNRMTLDGITRGYRAVYLPVEVAASTRGGIYVWPQNVLAHEMGHTLDLCHSSGAYASTYDSGWDVMSGMAWAGSVAACARDSTYGCVAPHTIAYHKALLGWITPAQTVIAAPDTSRLLSLANLSRPVAGQPLYLQIPRADSTTRFYTAEARGGGLYEESLPHDAIVLHDVDTTRWDRNAQVVDPDRNGNPNDAAAQWLPGETFNDGASGVSICVESATAYGYLVGVSNGAGDAPCSFKPHFATTTSLGFTPQSGAPGATLQFELAIHNGGAGLARNVEVSLTLPAGVTINPLTVEVANGHVASLAPLVFRAGAMVGGAHAHLRFSVQVDANLPSAYTPVSTGAISWEGGAALLDSSVAYNDATPPVTSAQMDAVATDGPENEGSLLVTLAARDSGAGLLESHYSMDGGTTWQIYRTPFAVQAERARDLLVMSIDNAGNQETAHAALIDVDSTQPAGYLPLVRR
jgi:uncharacterized repeat protein (TIGR01451 family)